MHEMSIRPEQTGPAGPLAGPTEPTGSTGSTGPTGSTGFAEFTQQWVRAYADVVMATEAELTALDQQVGDGDFGTNLAAGLQATLRRLTAGAGGLAGGAVPAGLDGSGEPGDLAAGSGGPGAAGLGGSEVPGAFSGGEAPGGRPGGAAPGGLPGGTAPDGLGAGGAGGAQGGSAEYARRTAARAGTNRPGAPGPAGFTKEPLAEGAGRGTGGYIGPAPAPEALAGAAAAAWPLGAAADAFLDEVGGTSGPLFGLLFQELAAAVRASGADDPATALAVGVRNGLAAIHRVGDAEVGDKTLVDALAPAAAALSVSTATDPGRALAEAAAAAWQGVRSTARMTARRGRASYLGDRAAGVPDPGAVGIGLLFSSAAGGPVPSLESLLR